MKSRHTKFVEYISKKLINEGYKIIDKEVVVDGIILNNKKVRIDLLVEKDGILIPVECGKIRRPIFDRISKLKEKYGSFKHIPYGYFKEEKKDDSSLSTIYTKYYPITLYFKEEESKIKLKEIIAEYPNAHEAIKSILDVYDKKGIKFA